MISSFSNEQGACIDVQRVGQIVTMTETDDPARTIYTTIPNVKAFFDGVKAGEFDHLVNEDKDNVTGTTA